MLILKNDIIHIPTVYATRTIPRFSKKLKHVSKIINEILIYSISATL
jgi:hypothetical protein